MFKLRSEVSAYVRVCEHLIASTTIYGDEKLTADECELVEFYAGKLAKLTRGSTPDALQLDMYHRSCITIL